MQYVRASASDYDDWKTVHGNPGWGSDDLIPLLKKVSWVLVVVNSGHFYHPSLRFESHMADARVLTWQTETYQVTRDAPTHGTDGPLKVSGSLISLDFGDQYLQVVGELDPTRTQEPPDTDTNDLKTINVYTVGLLLYTLSPPLLIGLSCVFFMTTFSEMAQVRA